MAIVKRCFSCKQYFPSTTNSHIAYCPQCYPANEQYMVSKFKSTRCIPIEYFDIYDTDYPREQGDYERVCRICGCRLLRKDGKYSWQRRHCKDHVGVTPANYHIWGFVRDRFVFDFIRRHQVFILLRMLDEIDPQLWYRTYIYCERCGKLFHYSAIEVHHKVPVHTVTVLNYLLIWDTSNLEILCKDCHNKTDHFLKQTEEEKALKKAKELAWEYRKYKKIDSFF